MEGVLASAPLPAPVPDLYFDGNPVDLKRLLTHLRVRIMGNDQALNTETKKVSFAASHFRGNALDWLGTYLETHPMAFDDYDEFVESVNTTFSISGTAHQALLRAELENLKMKDGETLLFLSQFESITAQLGINSDASRLSLVLTKLSPYFADAIRKAGTIYTRWSTLRQMLVNLDAMRVTAGPKDPDSKRRRSKCGKCGKRGHTATECRSGN
jgi:hypothetical protein